MDNALALFHGYREAIGARMARPKEVRGISGRMVRMLWIKNATFATQLRALLKPYLHYCDAI